MDIIAKKFIQLKNKEKFDEYYWNKLKSKHKKNWNNQKYIFKILHFLFQFMKFMNLKKNRLPIHMKRKSLQPSKRRRRGINPKFRIWRGNNRKWAVDDWT